METRDRKITRASRSGRPPSGGILLALIVLATIGAGSFFLQREVADNVQDALLLSVAWAAVIGGAALLYARGHEGLTRPLLAGLALGAVAGGIAFYFASVRDVTVDEEIVVASQAADAQTAAAGLAPEMPGAPAPATPAPAAPAKPPQAKAAPAPAAPAPAPAPAKKPAAANLALASGMFTGEDGHDGSGTATLVKTSGGQRQLTFTDFDVDPGAKVEVWLTRGPNETNDKIELGGLKGNRGNQQYKVPASADLNRYSTVILYCTPFTVRIAVAPLKPA